jgi:hypothetical protein
MLPARLAPVDPGEAPFRATPLTRSSAREETMASWQIKGLLVLGAALAATALAASATATGTTPEQVAADQIAGHGDASDQTSGALAWCLR